MKNIRIILSVLFLIAGAGSLLVLASAHAGGSNALGNFLFSGYSYMAYTIPLFYFWFFTLFFVGKSDARRVLWPIISIIPFVFFTLALRIQQWDGFHSTSLIIENTANLFGKNNAVMLFSIAGILFVVTEVALYGVFFYKKKTSHIEKLEKQFHTLEEEQAPIKPIYKSQMNRFQNNIQNPQYYPAHPVMHKSPYMPSTLPEKRQYNPQQQTPQPIKEPVQQQAVQTSVPIQESVPISPTPTNASSDSNKYSDELMLVFNKKKNSLNNNQNTPFEYTVLHTEEVDNTMIGLEGYINTESLNHIDFEKEKEKENHIHQENLDITNGETYKKAAGESVVAYDEEMVVYNNAPPIEKQIEKPVEHTIAPPIEKPIEKPVENTYAPTPPQSFTSISHSHHNLLNLPDDLVRDIKATQEHTPPPLPQNTTSKTIDIKNNSEKSIPSDTLMPTPSFKEVGDEILDDALQATDTIIRKNTFYEDEFYDVFFEDEEETEQSKDFIAEDTGAEEILDVEEDIEIDCFSEIDIDDIDIRIDDNNDHSESEASITLDPHVDDETEEPVFSYSAPNNDTEKMYAHNLNQPSSMNIKPRKRRGNYTIPIIGLLNPPEEALKIDVSINEKIARLLESTLQEFKIEAKVIAICRGPVVTMFEILPAHGVRLRKIVELSDNIALRLAAPSIRIVAPIPGKEAVGIEVPNEIRDTVSFSELMSVKKFVDKSSSLPIALGKNISNDIQIMDLSKTPHLLIAGATGSGKSVCVNAIITSLLYRCPPDEVKLILIDPKIVELSFYNGIAHLLTPVISDAAQSLQALRWCVEEMERRYRELETLNVREIKSYNKKLKEKGASKKISMPFIVVIIDEFADLMMTCGKEIEILVSRLTAKSRAIGIHLVIATQRPSTDVITGLIKSNIPTRISFMVTSKTDSRIILDMNGAENLLGKGDMLYSSASDPFPERMQGPYLSEEEVENVVEYVKEFAGEPDYISDEMFAPPEQEMSDSDEYTEDPLWDAVIEEVMRAQKASASHLQRRFKIGYNRAARLVEDMEERGIIGPGQGSKPREVYANDYA